MNDHPEISTDRLVLAPLERVHAEPLFKVLSDPAATRFWHAPPHRAVDETLAYINTLKDGRSRAWALIPRESPETIGLVYYLSDLPPVGLGYILHPALWGRGMALEATREVLACGFGPLAFDRVELWIESDNERSLALADRLGFARCGSFRAEYDHRERSHENIVLGLYAGEARVRPRPSSNEHFYSCVPVLRVPDVAATIAYYRDKLGFQVEFAYGEPVVAGRVHRSDWSGSGPRVQFARSASNPVPDGVGLYFEVGPDIDSLCARYRSAGVTIEREPEAMAWGRREFAIRDCNGFLLRFATPG